MLSLITDRWETVRRGPANAAATAPPVISGVRVLVLLLVLVTVPLASPHPGLGDARMITIAVLLGVCAIAWLVWLRASCRYRVMVTALAVMAVAGGTLAGLSPFSTAVAVCCVVTSSAGVRLSTEASLTITAATVAAFLIAGFVVGAPAETLAGYPAAMIGLWAFGLTRRAYVLRAEEAEAALEQARRAHAAENQASALAERARIAREIHDVLAHSLAAVSVNLQAAEGLLGELPADARGSEVVQAMECIERAVAFTRDGMTETRRAIIALREGADAGDGATATPASGPAPTRLVAELEKLTDDYRADGDAIVDLELIGEPRPVGAEAALTAYRTAQEALTNARKHAPGEPVTVGLTFAPAALEVRVVNPLPAADGAGPLARAGAGVRADRAAGAGRAGRRHAHRGAGRWTMERALEDPSMTDSDAPVTVVVADDQSAVREGLVLLLGTLSGVTVAGQAADGDAAVALVAATGPQVVLMDLNMPGCDGVSATRRITAEHPSTRVVVLTTYADDESIIGALQAGALGYLTKDATRAEIGRAIMAAADGQAVLDPGVQRRLLSAATRTPAAPATTPASAGVTPAGGAAAPSGDPGGVDDLTPREAEVLKLIAAGQSNREIARTLYVSEATVKTHVNRIFAKTGSRDRVQAMRYAYTHGYATPT